MNQRYPHPGATAADMRPDVSILVVNWNTRDRLQACLRSLFAVPGVSQVDGLPVEVLVVDNASHDGSAMMVQRDFPWVRLIANAANVGFARANNQLLPLARGRYVLLLNPDTVVLPGAVRDLVRLLDARPDVGAAGSRLLNPDGSLQVSCYRAPTLLREAWRLLHLDRVRRLAGYNMAAWDTQQPREVDVVQGAAMMLPRRVLETMPLFDEDYFIYSEEVDLCERLRERGLKIAWVPSSRVFHYGGESTRQVAAAMFLRLHQGKVLYFRKHRGRSAARLYKLILLAAAGPRLALGPFAWLGSPTTNVSQRTIASHYWRLVRALPTL